MTEAARSLLDALITDLVTQRRAVFVAIDGRSGAGKSTLAAALAAQCQSRDMTDTVIEGDEFYSGGSAKS